MKTIKEYKNINEALGQVMKFVRIIRNQKRLGKISDEILFSNLQHDLESFINYKKSEGRKEN